MLAEHEIRHILVDLRAAVGCLVKRRSTTSNGCTRITRVVITSLPASVDWNDRVRDVIIRQFEQEMGTSWNINEALVKS